MSGKFEKQAVTQKNNQYENMIKREQRIYSTPGDQRSDFERDYTRILHSNSFRRMKHKTQVFFNVENDHICTRMEHVLHVESVSHSIAQSLGLNCELTKAIAMGHDLGHTPFGHEGERILNDIAVNGIRDGEKILNGFSKEFLSSKNVTKYFWHEKNSLRMVDKIDLLPNDTGEYNNLDLTYAVRDGIICHCGELKIDYLKPRSELLDLNNISNCGQYEPATWEGCVVKLADKIAYLGRDIEDAIRLKFISNEDIEELKNIANNNENIVLNTTTLMHRMIVDVCNESSPEKGIVLGESNKKLIDNVLDFNREHIYLSQKFSAYKDYCRMVLSWIYKVLIREFDDNDTVKNLERLPYETLKNNFLDWLFVYADSCIIPDKKREDYKKYNNCKIYGKLNNRDIYVQSVIDFISGMTDSFAIKIFKEFITFR